MYVIYVPRVSTATAPILDLIIDLYRSMDLIFKIILQPYNTTYKKIIKLLSVLSTLRFFVTILYEHCFLDF